MPVYQYRCSECTTSFDLLRPMSAADVMPECPECHDHAHVSKLLSVFVSKTAGAVSSNDEAINQAYMSGGGGCCGGSCGCGHH